jgi:hypothetical protein
MTAALYIAENFGAPPEESWPYVAGSRDLPKGVTWENLDADAAKFRARTVKLSGYEDIPGQLAHGRPVLAEVIVTSPWFTPEARKTGVIRLGDNKEILGDFVVVIVAFDSADSSVKFANSWGVNWGPNGFGSMSAKVARSAVVAMWAVEVPPPES